MAKRLGVTPSTAYLWVKEANVQQPAPAFARVVAASAVTVSRSVIVEVLGATIRVEPGFDVDLLQSVVAALRGAT